MVNTIAVFHSKLIAFTKDESQADWKGYYYACVLFMTSIMMSILLGQYSIRMYLIGVKIRTAITSTVYRKVGGNVNIYFRIASDQYEKKL